MTHPTAIYICSNVERESTSMSGFDGFKRENKTPMGEIEDDFLSLFSHSPRKFFLTTQLLTLLTNSILIESHLQYTAVLVKVQLPEFQH